MSSEFRETFMILEGRRWRLQPAVSAAIKREGVLLWRAWRYNLRLEHAVELSDAQKCGIAQRIGVPLRLVQFHRVRLGPRV